MRSFQGSRTVLAAALACLAAACASTRPTEDVQRDEVRRLIDDGQYEQAVTLAAQRHEANPQDAAAELDWRLATVALLLERGRRAAFEDRDVDALDFFREAQRIGPDVPQVQPWIDTTLDKLSRRWNQVAQEWHAQDTLDRAIEAYEKALSYDPEYASAKEGLSRALLQQNFRNTKGEHYYENGVDALDEFWLEEAAHDFSASLKYREGHERAEMRRSQTHRLRADERAAIAYTLEAAGQWAAARNEYRIATLIDAQHPDAVAGLERMKREEKAAQLLRDADNYQLRLKFDRAQAALDEGQGLTERQVEAYDEARTNLAQARLRQKYHAARSLESDMRFEDAIAAYAALLAETPSFEDAIARKDTLEDYVAKAEHDYAEAMAATEPAAQLAALRRVMVVYPEYRDTRDRVAALEAQLGPEPEIPPR